MAAYFSQWGVTVNSISPGGFNSGLKESFVRDYSDRTPLGRMGEIGSDDLKGAVLFLASDTARYVTGQNIAVDGGWTIWH